MNQPSKSKPKARLLRMLCGPSAMAGAALVFGAILLIWPLGSGGAWDPYEFDSADLARRISVQLFGARQLAMPGDPGLPTLSDLGMGELPATSMALSFRCFGLSEWAGRLPMGLFALAGLMSVYLLVARFVGSRLALLSALILATLPLYAQQARTMLGDAVMLGAFAMSLSGLSLAAFDPSRRVRVGGLLWGGLGLISGFMSRGLLLGVAAPCLAVGIAGFVATPVNASDAARASPRRILASAALALGMLAALLFAWRAEKLLGTDAPLQRELGMVLFDPTPGASTFDRMLRQLGHATFPWSALLPLALFGLVAEVDPVAGSTSELKRATLATVLLSAIVVAFALGSFSVPLAGAMPFVGVAALAPAMALALDQLNHGQRSSRLAALLTLLWGVVLVVDLRREPDRLLSAFARVGAAMPGDFEDVAKDYVLYCGAASLLVTGLALVARQGTSLTSPLPIRAFWRAEWHSVRRALRRFRTRLIHAFQGNLLFFLVVFEAGLVGLSAMLFIGRRSGFSAVEKLPEQVSRWLGAAWWALPLGLAAITVASFVSLRAFEFFAGLTRMGRGGFAAIASLAAALAMSLSFYPALAAQLSPKDALESYRRLAREGDELALLGASPRAATFYFRDKRQVFSEAKTAFDWLGAETEARRFLLLKARDLPQTNSLWRGAYGENLPLVDARFSDNLLASNLLAGQPNENPLGQWILDTPPAPARPLAIRFQDHLEAFGWEVLDSSGRPVDSLNVGDDYRLRFYLRVLDQLGDWQAFVHVDGRSRQNVDHAPLGGIYPMPLWHSGDVMVDESKLVIGPEFGASEVWIMFGFFQGKSRLVVTEGTNRDNRAVAGKLVVR